MLEPSQYKQWLWVIPLGFSVVYLGAAIAMFGYGSVTRTDYDAIDMVRQAYSKITWEHVNVEKTLELVGSDTEHGGAVPVAYVNAGNQMAAKGIEEMVPMYDLTGVYWALCALGSFVLAAVLRTNPFSSCVKRQQAAAKTTAYGTGRVTPEKMMREFALVAFVYALISSAMPLFVFTLLFYFRSQVTKDEWGTGEVWLTGGFSGFSEFLRCWYSVLNQTVTRDGETYTEDEYAAFGLLNGCSQLSEWESRVDLQFPGLYPGIGPLNGAAKYPYNRDAQRAPNYEAPFDAFSVSLFPRTTAVYVVIFIELLNRWAYYGAAPVLLYRCLFSHCPAVFGVIIPQLSLLWLSAEMCRTVISRYATHIDYLYGEDVWSGVKMKFTVTDQNGQSVNDAYFNYEIAAMCVLSAVATVSVFFESLLTQTAARSALCALVALILPFMLYCNVWSWKDAIFGGSEGFGSLWFKTIDLSEGGWPPWETINWPTFSVQFFLVRMVLVMGVTNLAEYVCKKCTELLPMGELRYALPLFFISFWGTVGRVLQSSIPSWYMNALIESIAVAQELLKVWAYMHCMGPTAYLIRKITRMPLDSAEGGETVLYKTVADIPPKLYAYNYLICVHAICEAIMVITGGLVPLVMNLNLSVYCNVNYPESCNLVRSGNQFPQDRAISNTLISLAFESLIADGVFCYLAIKQQRKAHSFLASWHMRSFGSLAVYIACTLFASLPVFFVITLNLRAVRDQQMFGVRYFPWQLQCYAMLRAYDCVNVFGGLKDPLPEKCLEGVLQPITSVPSEYGFQDWRYPAAEWCNSLQGGGA